MTFGEINAEIEKLFDENIDSDTGEIIAIEPQVFLARMDELFSAKEEKIDNMVGAFKYYSTLAEGIKAEKLALAKRQQIAENRANSIKGFLELILDGEKIEKPTYKIGWRKNTKAVCEIPAENLADIYRRVKYEPDLTSIKSALKEGATIEGCSLVESNNIQIK